MSVVQMVPKEEQVLILDTDIATYIPIPLDLEQTCLLRLSNGAEKYGTSWNEVDLKTDLLEELYDCLNYPRMAIMRMRKLDELGILTLTREEQTRFVLGAAAVLDQAQEMIYTVMRTWPDFDGPTSAEWSESHG